MDRTRLSHRHETCTKFKSNEGRQHKAARFNSGDLVYPRASERCGKCRSDSTYEVRVSKEPERVRVAVEVAKRPHQFVS